MKTKLSTRINPVYWSVLIFVIAQLLTFLVITRENQFLEANHIYIPPTSSEAVVVWPQPTPPAPAGETPAPPVGSLGPILIYFAAVVITLGLVLFFIPISALRMVFRILFAFLFSWGIFIITIFWVPLVVAIVAAAAIGIAWFFIPAVWLHDSVMILTMVSLGAVFGRLISPWTVMVLISALAVYDFLAVRFGYMLWMTKKLSETTTLPAFVIPRNNSEWKSSIRASTVTELINEEPDKREYSILGGGDIGFPLLLISSSFFGYGLGKALIISVFSIFGLIGAYWIQAVFLKGKAMPALPPIALMCLIALLIVRYSGL